MVRKARRRGPKTLWGLHRAGQLARCRLAAEGPRIDDRDLLELWREQLDYGAGHKLGDCLGEVRLQRRRVATRLDEARADTRERAGANVRVKAITNDQDAPAITRMTLSLEHLDCRLDHVRRSLVPALAAHVDPAFTQRVQQLPEHGAEHAGAGQWHEVGRRVESVLSRRDQLGAA